MSDARLAARRAATQQSFYRLLGGRSFGSAYASVVPSAPDRSLFNAVTYVEPIDVPPPDVLAELYDAEGVRAWTVWVQPGDAALAEALAAAGNVLDATPEAMGAELSSLALDGPDVASPVGWDEMVATNEAAYGMPAGGLGALRLAGDGLRLYGTAGGAVVLAIHDHVGDAGLTFVAARPEARGRGHVAALLRQALRDAVARGCTTTTLESTKLGRPVYERVGYRSLGTLEMWERRRPRPN